MKEKDNFILDIKRLGINGEGIGYYKRLAVFIPFSLPTEEVVVRATEVKEQYAKAKIVKIKTKSDKRINPYLP